MIVFAVFVWAVFAGDHPWVALALAVHLLIRVAVLFTDPWNNLRPPDDRRPPGPITPVSPDGGEVDPLSLEWEQLQVMEERKILVGKFVLEHAPNDDLHETQQLRTR